MKISSRLVGMGLILSGLCIGVAAFAQGLSDAEIAGIVKAGAESTIDEAKTVKSRSSNQQIKDYAEQVINENKANLKTEKKLDNRLKIKPSKTDVSTSMSKDIDGRVADLKQMQGEDFDRTYIKSQIALQQQMLTDLDQTLIPNAESPDLKDFLQSTRQQVQDNLTQAQALQTNLGSIVK